MEVSGRIVDWKGDHRWRHRRHGDNGALGSLNARLLLDTHVVVRWLAAPKKLSREQSRVLREAVRRHEPVAVSAITLLEIAVLFGSGTTRSDVPVNELLDELASGSGLL